MPLIPYFSLDRQPDYFSEMRYGRVRPVPSPRRGFFSLEGTVGESDTRFAIDFAIVWLPRPVR